MDPIADRTNMLTVWIALSDAPVERGCLQVIPRSHRQALRTHCPGKPGRPFAISDALLDLDRATPVPTRAGDVILMHKHTIHGSLPNVSEAIRWSLDLRYNPTGQPTGRPQFPGFVARSRRDPTASCATRRPGPRSGRRLGRSLPPIPIRGRITVGAVPSTGARSRCRMHHL